jgi:GH15 family glucan-1,4-alpha-glucosidase
MNARIEDYALIGDCETAALVCRTGSIDWLCWPRFDSGACFAALLGTPYNGRWQIAPVAENARVTRRYRPNTLILETEFATADGEAVLIDFMPLKSWEAWTSTHRTIGRYADCVTRSLITLKALTYEPTGGIVAAPTTSLPEQIGGPRNWDYRYCWLRDATLTLLALMNSGYYDEAECWRNWLLRAAAGSPTQVQIMYGVAGEKRLVEWELRGLSGYEGSTPVRIGNAAANQLQLDVFGEVMDALHQARVGGVKHLGAGWDFQRALLSHLEKVWSSPDEGIWEVRARPQHFTHSKVMAWVERPALESPRRWPYRRCC